MKAIEIIFVALACSFCWVEILVKEWGVPFRKPFNCMKCLTGWFAFIFAVISYCDVTAFVFLPVGVFVGAMFEGITMRYL